MKPYAIIRNVREVRGSNPRCDIFKKFFQLFFYVILQDFFLSATYPYPLFFHKLQCISLPNKEL